jgi:CMP-N-acetylneuraminic acid synthetase
MDNHQEICAIIPARSGSKSVKNKNIRLLNGKPMIAYSIEHAFQSQYITRVIVSTDSNEYAKIAKEYGAETPFIRPANIATDTSLDLEVFQHALSYMYNVEQYMPNIVVHLRPTYPIRNVSDIDAILKNMIANPDIDSVRCITPAKEIPYKMWLKKENGIIEPLLTDIPEAYNMPRQALPKAYYQNACIDTVRSSVILEKKSMTGDTVLGYKMDHFFDIDTEEDFVAAEKYLKLTQGRNKFVFDIDGVVAEFNESLKYELSTPNTKMIEIINALFEYGNTITLFTARDYKTGINWEKTTKKQLSQWGIKYHELKFGKPDADFYVDDKSLDIEMLCQIFSK